MVENRDNFEPHDPMEAQVEVMVGEHLNAKLGGQVGRASAAFSAAMARETHAREVRRIRRTMLWMVVPAAVAACVAVAVMMGGKGNGRGKEIVQKPEATPAPVQVVSDEGSVASTTYYRDVDGGVQVVDGAGGVSTPVRAIRRQLVDETEWYDPTEKATITVTSPREEVVYVNADAY